MWTAFYSCAPKYPSHQCQHHHAPQHRGRGGPNAPQRTARGSPKEPYHRLSPKQSGALPIKGAKSAGATRRAFALTTSAVSPTCAPSWAASKSTLTTVSARETALILGRRRIGQPNRGRPCPTMGPVRSLHSCPCRQRLTRRQPCPARATTSLAHRRQGHTRLPTQAHRNHRCIRPLKGSF